LSEDETGSCWVLDVASYLPVPVPIEIVETMSGGTMPASVQALEVAIDH
jgi:hypothetical protein